jgi:nitrogen fixation NifU-like protein
MPDLRELYQETILDHSRTPRNYHKVDPADRKAVGNNPLCGDQVILYLRMDGDRIVDVGFEGQGCAISKASASMMTEMIKGKTEREVDLLFVKFHEMVTGKPRSPADAKALGKLTVFGGVSEFPARVKCASLGWHTLKAALESRPTVSME